jgi:hypothetical protein
VRTAPWVRAPSRCRPFAIERPAHSHSAVRVSTCSARDPVRLRFSDSIRISARPARGSRSRLPRAVRLSDSRTNHDSFLGAVESSSPRTLIAAAHNHLVGAARPRPATPRLGGSLAPRGLCGLVASRTCFPYASLAQGTYQLPSACLCVCLPVNVYETVLVQVLRHGGRESRRFSYGRRVARRSPTR